jgi:hypothetical protein
LSGVLLVTLGALHLLVTPLIGEVIRRGIAAEAVKWLTPPMLLNHVVVGILLLPLGGLTLYAAPHAARGARWALVVTRLTAVTVATLPPTLFAIMGTRYFGAVPFLIATGIVCAVSMTLLMAAFWPSQGSVDATTAEQPAPPAASR